MFRHLAAAGILLTLILSAAKLLSAAEQPRRIQAFGRTWLVKQGHWGPGPNTFSADNVTVDQRGWVHLYIRQPGPNATCAELVADDRQADFGEYRWVLSGQFANYDANTVGAVFLYGADDNETDWEISRWSRRDEPQNAQFAVQPTGVGDYRYSTGQATVLTVALTWTKERIEWRCWPGDKTGTQPAPWTWRYEGPKVPRRRSPGQPGPVHCHINLWLFKGQPLTAATSQELVIREFQFTPLNDVRKTR